MNSTDSSNDAFFGHPKGLKTLFFTEMWERMSYYGMRALLVLFMTLSLQEGGLGITVAMATAIYGLYTGFVYLAGLPGGWIADRLIGGQNAIWYGGIIIMFGHISLAIPGDVTFYFGLILVVLGTGLLKPNITAAVGQLYKGNDPRMESGYALYYMGINLGSIGGYLICGWLYDADSFGPHWAVGAAAVGMAIGLLQFKLTRAALGEVGLTPIAPLSEKGRKTAWTVIGLIVLTIVLVAVLALAGTITLDPVPLAQASAVIFTLLFIGFFGKVFFFGKLNALEKKSMLALLLVCVASACFWSGFEQAGSSLNLFAQQIVDRQLGSFEIPTAWFQFVNPFFIIILSPFFAALWINLGKRMTTPGFGLKTGAGILIMASGFIVMYFAAQLAAAELRVAPYWLVATYFLHTVGELCLSPIALAAVSRLSPKRFAGQMMGVFVLTYSIGNIIAGLLAGGFDPENVQELPALFMNVAQISLVFGVVILLIGYKTRKWEVNND